MYMMVIAIINKETELISAALIPNFIITFIIVSALKYLHLPSQTRQTHF